jgi:peroxiredoxin
MIAMRETTKKATLSACVLALTLGLAATAAALAVGARAPELGANDQSGNRVTIAGLRGSVVVVDFWASWCGPCAEEMPELERLYQRHRERGLVIVGVSQDRQASNMQSFLSRGRVTFPNVHDGSHAIAGRYVPPRMPTSYVIDRRGVVRHVHAGYRAGDAATLEREIVALLDAQ